MKEKMNQRLFLAGCLGLAMCVQAVELDTVDPWRIKEGAEAIAVPAVDLVTVVGEKLENLPEKPAKGWTCGHWQRGRRLAALIAYECSVQGALLPNSVVVKKADGTLLEAGKDYDLEKDWACVARLAGGRIGADETVLVDYTYRPQRLDRIVRTAEGKLALRTGTPKASNPVLPAAADGEKLLATLWLDGRTERLAPRNLYRVQEPAYPEAPVWGPSVAERLLPKTWAKLEKGEPVTVLAWGDSVTNGGYLPEEDRWQGQFIRRLRARYPKSDIKLVSNGWGGRNSDTFRDVAKAPSGSPYNYQEKVLGVKADLVVMEFVNDSFLKTHDALKTRYDQILADFKAHGSELCVLTPHYVRADWMGLADPTATVEDPRPYVKVLRAWAGRNNVALADASLRWGRLYRQGIPYQTLLVNEINHPNAQGMSYFADALMELFRGHEGPGPMRSDRQLVWSDEFNGTALDLKKWRFRRTMYGKDCVYSNDTRTARVENGCLHMQVHLSGRTDKKFMLSEGVSTLDTMVFKYGYLEMRARMPFRHGAWPSFWMQSAQKYRTVSWMAETDIFEVFSNPNTVVANIHKWGGGKHTMLPGGEGLPSRGFKFDEATINDEFHVYGFEWNPREMIFYVDDQPYYRCPIDEVHDFDTKVIPGMGGFHDPEGIIFNNEIFTPGHGWCPKGFELTEQDAFPIDYWIDWVRLWQNPKFERKYE